MKTSTSRFARISFSLASVCLVTFLGICFTPANANAFLELRGSYGLYQANPSQINSSFTYPKLDQMTGYSADAILSLIGMPFGVGVRYEDFEKKASNAAGGYDATYKRVSLLVNKRFIDTIGYIGLLGTVGVSNDFKYAINGGATGKATGISGSAGLEAGVKLGVLLVGAELGYMYAPLSNLKSGGSDLLVGGHTVKVDLSGAYARGTVGFAF
jgi:hypothetical protein